MAAAHTVFFVTTVVGLAAGGLFWVLGWFAPAHGVWAVTAVVALVPAVVWMVVSIGRRQPGVDVIAVLALVGTLVVGEYLAGALIAVMLASGRALEAWAGARARRELSQLVGRTPRTVHRYEHGLLVSVPIEDVRPGDLLVVRPGDVVAVDGVVTGATALVDESALTGEPLPVERHPGEAIRSGSVNAGSPFDFRATTTAAESAYAGIVRLVEQAQADSAPFVRLADRYAAVFVPLTLALGGIAWVISGSLARAVAVLVVATPCPLIIAAPVAIVAGLSQAARRGVIIKGGGPLEALARARVLLFDKTGTLTAGRPTLIDVITPPGGRADEVLRLAGSLDQISPHVLATAIVQAAHGRGIALTLPSDVTETPGVGITGVVEGQLVSIGKASAVRGVNRLGWMRTARRRADLDGAVTVFVQVDREPVGVLLLHDPIRSDAAKTIRALRRAGIDRLVMVSGDRWQTAEMVGAALGVDEVLAERTPSDKVDAVRVEGRFGPTVMVGDGINDAPALALADVGVAIASRGATASSETADIVLTVDRLDRLGDAVVIARRSRRIAYQSVVAGMGLSLTAMGVAAAGWLPATYGALLQEVIDVAVILNSLRALIPPPGQDCLHGAEADLARQFRFEHQGLRTDIEQIKAVADEIGVVDNADLLVHACALEKQLTDEVLVHEMAEDRQLYPVIARALGGTDPTGSMSRAHVEIAHTIRRLGRLLDDIDSDTVDDTDLAELRLVLYGLYALLRLHFAQEEEGYFSLIEEDDQRGELVTHVLNGAPPG